jgi:hypothetical protein
MAGISSGVEATKGYVTKHWIAFGVVAFFLVAFALSYDHKNQGKLSVMIGKIPGIGGLFS